MTCINQITRRPLTLVLSLLLSCLFTLLCGSSSSFAVADISVTYSNGDSISQYQDVFPTCNSAQCISQFQYLIYSRHTSNPVSGFNYFGSTFNNMGILYSSYNDSNFIYLPYRSNYSILDISPLSSLSLSRLVFSQAFNLDSWGPLPSSGDYFTLTLTDHLPGADCPPIPDGSITFTENGTYDVSSYAEAVVDVPATVIQGDYHDDLIRILNAIYCCSGVMLVLYFFYCIYRLIIKNTGDK